MTDSPALLGKAARMTALAGLAAALLALPSASSLAQTAPSADASTPADAPLPGYWKYTYRAFIFSDDDQKCLTPADVKRFFDGLCNKSSKCTYSVNEAHDGKVRMVGVWVDHKGRRAEVSGTGVYDPQSFKINAHIVLHHLGFPLPVDGTISGKRTSAVCPAGTGIK